MNINFKQISEKDVFDLFSALGQQSYRAKQTLHWLYDKLARSFDEMTSLPKGLRSSLSEKAYISNLTFIDTRESSDGTQKFLFGLEDGMTIESVLIPGTTVKTSHTLCISSQIGCPLGCKFCVTGKTGFKRNLLNHEIADQILSVQRLIRQSIDLSSSSDIHKRKREQRELPKLSNIVLMGMGEPLLNIKEVNHALWKITRLMGFSKRKITVSTAGIVPGIYELGSEGPDVNLAVSLNATTDTERNMIMPINKKYPLKKLLQACRDFPLSPRRRITFEYVLLDDVNDSMQDARRLAKLLKGIRSKINLIPYNRPSSFNGRMMLFDRPDDKKITAFQDILDKAGMTAIIRKSMGTDISAACGQLKASYMEDETGSKQNNK